jgi:hypothetical protein
MNSVPRLACVSGPETNVFPQPPKYCRLRLFVNLGGAASMLLLGLIYVIRFWPTSCEVRHEQFYRSHDLK